MRMTRWRGMAQRLNLAGSLQDVSIGLTEVYISKTVGNIWGLKWGIMTPNSVAKVDAMFT